MIAFGLSSLTRSDYSNDVQENADNVTVLSGMPVNPRLMQSAERHCNATVAKHSAAAQR